MENDLKTGKNTQGCEGTNSRSAHPISAFSAFFQLQAANAARSYVPFTLVFLEADREGSQQASDLPNSSLLVQDFLLAMIRDSDLLFTWKENRWILMLSHSGQLEASFFLKRMLTKSKDGHFPFVFFSGICEIGNGRASCREVLLEGDLALCEARNKGESSVQMIARFREREVEQVKVSILQQDPMIRHMFHMLLQRSVLDQAKADIREFRDGEEFLQSGWYQSAHPHLILMDEILPRKSGLEVLHTLRHLPNEKKYLICMLSNEKRESDRIYGYELGVDEYIMRPFNMRLVEARLKRLLKRRR
ncbi:response regulator [Bacillus xiapuensis]|uniref:response regulator n=1 Tax=Bacillus xiapuensis TaxID=2014075 RepID=UPI000C23D8F6|nr:response regulator [Bacillus xiapuensis]